MNLIICLFCFIQLSIAQNYEANQITENLVKYRTRSIYSFDKFKYCDFFKRPRSNTENMINFLIFQFFFFKIHLNPFTKFKKLGDKEYGYLALLYHYSFVGSPSYIEMYIMNFFFRQLY